jgi:hypothetical protein
MKTNKPKVQKKVAKKAAKKDLEKTLTERFLEVISQLGHDAGKVGDDIAKAGKTIAKKLAKKVTTVQEAVGLKDSPEVKKVKKTPEAKKEKGEVAQDNWTTKPEKIIKPVKSIKSEKQGKKVETETPKPRPLAQSVKVTPISSAAHAEKALAKNAVDNTSAPVAKKRPSRAKAKAEVFPEDPEMPENTEPA